MQIKFNRYIATIGAHSLLLLTLLLSACSFTKKTASPVIDLRNQQALNRGYHVVNRGETLYFIAWRFDKDYRELAHTNHLNPPYHLRVGEKIYLYSKADNNVYRPTINKQVISKHKRPTIYSAKPYVRVKRWLVPAQGSVIQTYSGSGLNKGINIAGKLGEAIRATAAGEVVYAGSSLRGYGKLLLIKHNDLYLSAYAHNKTLLVHEGDTVKAGQTIALMGSTGANRVMLHFELRKRGKPVNPLKYIKLT